MRQSTPLLGYEMIKPLSECPLNLQGRADIPTGVYSLGNSEEELMSAVRANTGELVQQMSTLGLSVSDGLRTLSVLHWAL